jgi:hypothetical protein
MPMLTVVNQPISPIGSAILELVDELHEEGGECTIADLEEHLEQLSNGDPADEVIALIKAGLVYVSEPLARLDWDTQISPVQWVIGRSTVSDIERHFGEPAHGIEDSQEGQILTYDLYVENVEDGYPLPPTPYDVRNADDEDRPEGCTFPYTGIWPPEAIQVEFAFDRAETLTRYRFKVGMRLT